MRRASLRPLVSSSWIALHAQRRTDGLGGRAARVERVRARRDLVAIAQPVAVRVRGERVRPDLRLLDVAQAVAVAVGLAGARLAAGERAHLAQVVDAHARAQGLARRRT